MFASIYSFRGEILIPTLAETDAGFHLEVEPVEVLSRPTVTELALALERVRSRGNPGVPTPSRGNYPEPVVLKYTKLRSLSEFEKIAQTWSLVWLDDSVEIMPTRRVIRGGYEHLPAQKEVVHDQIPWHHLATRVLQHVREAPA
jgi:hypothetical protein